LASFFQQRALLRPEPFRQGKRLHFALVFADKSNAFNIASGMSASLDRLKRRGKAPALAVFAPPNPI
jgi:hypothetical protein